jgi:hypothetical protein
MTPCFRFATANRVFHLACACALAACASEIGSIEEALGPGGDDGYEQNDSSAQATPLGAATGWPATAFGNQKDVTPLISRPGDADWFTFDLPADARVTLTITTMAPLDVTWTHVIPPTGGAPGVRTIVFSGTVSSPLSIDPVGTDDPPKLPSGRHEIKITSNNDGSTPYSLSFRHVPDGDDDGTPDPADLCPDFFNLDQDDHDGDGIGNSCDSDCISIICTDTSATGACQGLVDIGDGASTPFYRTHRLMVRNECITRAIFYVHGSSRSPTSGYDALVDTADANGVLPSTLVAAPWFQAFEDCTSGTCPAPERIYFDDNGWSQGDDGVVLATPLSLRPHSSYEYMDALIELVTEPAKFPNLREVIVTGHSAGGQYTQRYAAGGLEPNVVPAGVAVRFLPANPSSYMLVHPSGVNLAPGDDVFDLLEAFTYKYGLVDRNRYMNLLTSSEDSSRLNPLVDQYLDRDVTYLIGSEDYCDCNCFTTGGVACDGAISDGTCICGNAIGGTCANGNGNLACDDESLAQGDTRLDRAYNYIDHLDANFGNDHTLEEVPGAGHSSSDMMSCDPVPGILFGGPAVEGPDCSI